MKVVLDTSAVIYLGDFRRFDEILTVQEVLDEVKDRTSAMKLSGLSLNVMEPSEESVKKIRQAAARTGDLEKLSETDVKVLALAMENGCTLISDDRSVQNVAERIGLRYFSARNGEISNAITWRKYCTACRKFYDGKESCPVCGSELRRMPDSSEKISRKQTYKPQ